MFVYKYYCWKAALYFVGTYICTSLVYFLCEGENNKETIFDGAHILKQYALLLP